MSDHFQKTLQQRLKGQNLSKIARELDISKSVLFDWCKGRRVPSFKNLSQVKKLANYIGLSLDQLLLGEEKNRPLTSVQFQDSGREYQIKIERLK